MKSKEQIKEWLKDQPFYDDLIHGLNRCIALTSEDVKLILSGERGSKTMDDAVFALNPLDYDWDELRRDFRYWYDTVIN